MVWIVLGAKRREWHPRALVMRRGALAAEIRARNQIWCISMAETKNLVVRGARAHNLKNVNVELPRDRLIVITGLSGSGKSSLAFDTIYAEGQRRYVESLVGLCSPVSGSDGQARRRSD